MKVTPEIIRYEFIGTEGKVARSPHEGYVGLGGKVVSETKNTFTFLLKGKEKSVIKESAVFNFKFEDGTVVEIDGKLLVGRSEDRVKKSIKRLW
ncbi:MAG: ribonuclease P protein subunit [Candidatus Bathyarchaeota archaeon]|jgi:ribonuclease P protein subunit POP4|nr:ribonuclease P protein subunit [Candidatus Bathyarchaeota archaeon]